jgi:hypothetical protein
MTGTRRREGPGRRLIVNESHLPLVLTGYFQHYDNARPHRALGQLAPAQADTRPPDPASLAEHWIRRKQVPGGLTGEYCIAALPPNVATESADHRPKSYFRGPTGYGILAHNMVKISALAS